MTAVNPENSQWHANVWKALIKMPIAMGVKIYMDVMDVSMTIFVSV